MNPLQRLASLAVNLARSEEELREVEGAIHDCVLDGYGGWPHRLDSESMAEVRQDAARRRRELRVRRCESCGREYEPRHALDRYCGPLCWDEDHCELPSGGVSEAEEEERWR